MSDYLSFYIDTPMYTHPPGLTIMRDVMHRLGDPQDRLRCIHIAGTNGKGSCAAMTASILQEAGFRTGLYTSPDLNGLHERIQINGEPISDNDLRAVTDSIRKVCDPAPELSYFEKLTAAAFLYFHLSHCDYVVLETGLGGRMDATNIITDPVCSVIMPIGMDHTAVLGNTLTAIAQEKCGIIKPHCPVISAPQDPEALTVICAASQAQNTSLTVVDTSRVSRGSSGTDGQSFSYDGLPGLHITLLGPYQVENACAAICAARAAGISSRNIRQGLAKAHWPARLEYFPGTPPILIDGAHNPHGAAALSAALSELFPGQRFTMILAVMADKDWREILHILLPFADTVICTAPDSPRALSPDKLADAIENTPTRCTSSLYEALSLAKKTGNPVLACGSLYAVGALRSILLSD